MQDCLSALPFARMDAKLPDRAAIRLAVELAEDTCSLNMQKWQQAGWRDTRVMVDSWLTDVLDGEEHLDQLRQARARMNSTNPVTLVRETLKQVREADTCKAMILTGRAMEKTQIVFSFRGTSRRLFDWVSNFRMQQEAGVHQGFLELTETWIQQEGKITFPSLGLSLPEILQACREKTAPYRIVLVGHSQGSAIAQLYMEYLLHRQVHPACLLGICFASPSVMAGPGTAGPYPMIHLVNSDDVVPHMGAFWHLGEILVSPADAELRQACYNWDPRPEATEARLLTRAITGRMRNTEQDILVGMAYLRLLEEEPMGVLQMGLQSMGHAPVRLPGGVNEKLDSSVRKIIDRAEQYAADVYEELTGASVSLEDILEIMQGIREVTEKIGMVRFARAFGELCLEPHRITVGKRKPVTAYGQIARTRTENLYRVSEAQFLGNSRGD